MRKKMYAAAAALALCWSRYRVLRYPIHHSLMPMNLFVLPGRMLSVRSASAGNQMIRRMTFPEPGEGLQRRVIHVSDIRLTVYERPHHGPSPCLLYIHGGGFCFEDAPYIHRIVMRYAKEASCTVVFVHYHTSDRHPYPIPFQDCLHSTGLCLDTSCSAEHRSAQDRSRRRQCRRMPGSALRTVGKRPCPYLDLLSAADLSGH